MPQSDRSREPKSSQVLTGMLGAVIAVLLVLVAGAAAVYVTVVLPGRQRDVPPAAVPAVNVSVLPVTSQPRLLDTFDLHGVVEPDRVVSVAAEVDGRIERIDCQQGQRVKTGQELLRLNTDLLQAEYDRDRAQMEYDRREYERMPDAHARGAATATELDRARTKQATSKAAFALADARLKRSVIGVPIDGILDDLLVEVGEYVHSGQAVAKLVDIDRVKVVVQVPERDVPFLSIGQTEQIFLDNPGTAPRAGEVTFISELADERTHTSRVEITVDNPQHSADGPKTTRHLRTGRIVRVRLTRRALDNVIMIPLRAVIPLETEQAVYVVVDGKAERRKVVLGIIKGWDVQVVSGLSPGDRLIVAGHRYVAPGQPVREVETGADAAGEAPAGEVAR